MHRFLAIGVVGVLALVLCGAATAWSWPADGAVLRPFVLGTDAYAGGQHRGIDVAGADGSPVRAPAAGVVTFAGSLPTYGRGVTILTPDGYSVTLVHLGAIGVAKGDTVAEGATVGTMGASGTPEQAIPSVHLGVRRASEEQGYVDPQGLLPPRTAPASPPPPVADPAPVTPPAPVAAPPPPVAAPPASPASPPAVTPPSATAAPVTPPAAEPSPGRPLVAAPPGVPAPATSPAMPPTVDSTAGGDTSAGSAEASEPFVVTSSAPTTRAQQIGIHRAPGVSVRAASAAHVPRDPANAARGADAAPAPGAAGIEAPVSRVQPGPTAPARPTTGRTAEGPAAGDRRVDGAPARAATAVATRGESRAVAHEVAPPDTVPPGAARPAVAVPTATGLRAASAGAGPAPALSKATTSADVAAADDGAFGLPARLAAIALAVLLAAVAGRQVAKSRASAAVNHHVLARFGVWTHAVGGMAYVSCSDRRNHGTQGP